MKDFFRQLFRLIRLCVSGPGGRIGILYFFVILGLGFCGLAISIRMIAWSADFYNALQQVNGSEIVKQIGLFAVLTISSALLFLAGRYLQQSLQIKWRTVLTEATLDRWLGNHAHWHLKIQGETTHGIDNPDQRIAEDCRIFVQRFTGEGLDLINAIVSVISYFTLLWGLSTFELSFTVFGTTITIPRYMVWAAPVYVLLSSYVTHKLGAPLKQLNYRQQQKESDFRFALTHVRQASEAIALQKGEAAERKILDGFYAEILKNWRQLIRRDLILGCFTRPYMQTVLRIPMFLALPAFIAGKLTLGGLMQMASAFSNVVTTLSWFIFSYKDLAELAAATLRLGQFLDATEGVKDKQAGIMVNKKEAASVCTKGLCLHNPNNECILAIPDLTFKEGEHVWIKGCSGLGKSTFLKAVAGLWPYGRGIIETPANVSCLFLPQHPYLPLNGIHGAAVYPQNPESFAKTELQALLEYTRINPQRLSHACNPDSITNTQFSGGEIQRLSLLRLLANKPKWVFMDEPASALDPATERHIFSALRSLLPDTTFIIIAHRPPVGIGTYREVNLEAATA